MQIDLTSTPEDLIALDAAAAEKEILDSQTIADVTPVGGPLFTTQEICAAIDSYTAVPSSSSPLARKRVRSLHLEPPLTPQDHVKSASDDDESSAKRVKKVHFDPGIAAMLPDPQPESSDTLSGIAEQQAVELQNIIIHDAQSVQQQLQNENLVEIDTTLRVVVPQLEPVQPQIPWELTKNTESANGTPSQTRRRILRHFKQEFLKDTRKWGGVSKLERTLTWAPFPTHLAKVDLLEQFDDDGSLDILLDDLGLDDGTRDVDVQPMVVRDLRSHGGDDYDDEEIEPAVFDEDDLDCDFEEEERQVREPAPTLPLGIEKDIPDPERLSKLHPSTTRVNRDIPALPVTATSRTSAATANLMQGDGLAHFMQLRGKAPRLPKAVGEGLGRNTALPSVLLAPKSNLAPAAVMVPQVDNAQEQEPKTATISIPTPEVKQLATHHKIPIIVSSAFMAGDRRLLRLLKTTLPNIDICEREATLALLHNNNSSSGNSSTVEADLTISPSTGVILTTLQKLKQKPLPGQQTSPPGSLRARIASTAPRYERLIILVKESSSSNPSNPEIPTISAASSSSPVTNPLDNLDCAALSDLTVWTLTALSPGPEVQILYIPGGDSEAANWLASAVSHNHHPGSLSAAAADGNGAGDFCLLRDETMWERWLRAAGLNAFAAQVVLRSLRMKDSPPDSGGDFGGNPRFGLQAFIAMSLAEWIEAFAGLLGGERVLRRISEGLDGGWRGGSVR
jgi:hypothetical protein